MVLCTEKALPAGATGKGYMTTPGVQASTSPNALCWRLQSPAREKRGLACSHPAFSEVCLSALHWLMTEKPQCASCLDHCWAHSLKMTDIYAVGDIPHTWERELLSLTDGPSFEFSPNQRQPESTLTLTLVGLGMSTAPQQRAQAMGLATALPRAWKVCPTYHSPQPGHYAVAKQLGVANPTNLLLSLFLGSHPISFSLHFPYPVLVFLCWIVNGWGHGWSCPLSM